MAHLCNLINAYFRIFSTNSNVRATLYNVLQNKQHHRRVLLSSFHLNGHTSGLYLQNKSKNHLVTHNKQHHSKVLLSSFHLNDHTLGFQAQNENLKPLHIVQPK